MLRNQNFYLRFFIFHQFLTIFLRFSPGRNIRTGVNPIQIDRGGPCAHFGTTFGALAPIVVEKILNFRNFWYVIFDYFSTEIFYISREPKVCGTWGRYRWNRHTMVNPHANFQEAPRTICWEIKTFIWDFSSIFDKIFTFFTGKEYPYGRESSLDR